MKKLLSLMLCLMLCLPVLAVAETAAEPVLYTIDFGYFTMDLGENDQYQVAAERASNTVYAMIYVDYDRANTTHDTINVVWSTDDVQGEIEMVGGIQKYAELVLQNAEAQYTTMGIKMTDAQVLSAIFEEQVGATVTSCTMNYTAAGVDLVTPLYQMQVFYCMEEASTYILTLTSASFEKLQSMLSYLDTIEFK